MSLQDAQLEAESEATSLSVEDLLKHVRRGKLRVPRFQRGLKWKPDDAARLVESIYEGYPIGTLLLWSRPADEEVIELGALKISAPARSDAWWIIDGQQRISSLARILLGPGHPTEPFALFFDTGTSSFRRIPAGREPPAAWIPLTVILDSEQLYKWLLGAPSELQHAAFRLAKRIREYKIPAYLIHTDDEARVREVFRRTNSTSKRMEEHEVFDAIYGAKTDDSSRFASVRRQLEETGFGPLPEETLYRMLQALLGVDTSKRTLPELSAEAGSAAYDRLLQTAREVITFMQLDVGIPHIILLPYEQPLITLTRFFALHPRLHPRSRELLARWVWRGATSAQHRGDTLALRPTLGALREGTDEHASVQALLRTLHGRASEPLEAAVRFGDFSFRTARCKIQALGLLQLGPRDLRSGEPLRVDANAGALLRPIVRTAANRLGNRIMHPNLGDGMLDHILACEDTSILASHCISDSAAVELRAGNFDLFLQRREADLSAMLTGFLASRTRWDESDRPPISALIVPEGTP
jgi:hypothetical protein